MSPRAHDPASLPSDSTQIMPIFRNAIRKSLRLLGLPMVAKSEVLSDRIGLPRTDPGHDRAIREALAWLGRAQDHSASHDGGAAGRFSLIDGWSASYPETTGYIVPTLLLCAERFGDEALRERTRRMLDWLVSIQFPEGGFQGGLIDETPVVPVIFNTGQILMGLVWGTREWGDCYRAPMQRAAQWLTQAQDPDGCWRRHPSPFAAPGEKVYETHVAWGLLEAARVEPRSDWIEAAMRNVRWAMSHQRDNGWFARCCIGDERAPLTHTLGYVLRGIVEAYRFSKEDSLLRTACRTADGLLGAIRQDGYLPGRLDADWRGSVRWVCLTGSVQIAHSLLLLYQETQDPRYRAPAVALNRYVRRRMRIDGRPETRGGIKGSWPVDGEYCPLQYPNWACKFFIDSHLVELDVCREGQPGFQAGSGRMAVS